MAAQLPDVLSLPTGAGKTLAVLTSWLYRRGRDPDGTPLRLVYALPMRVLVSQVWDSVNEVLDRLGLDTEQIGRHRLQGGDADDTWLGRPEAPAVIVGTIDMLLSRALNRGYGTLGRKQWPMAFGQLNSDALWVLDEIQLMQTATVNTAQLDGLRKRLGTFRPVRSLWMSATVDPRLLRTVDRPDLHDVLELSEADMSAALAARMRAPKLLQKGLAKLSMTAAAVHRPGEVTLVVANTVERARTAHRELERQPLAGSPELLLLHSRYRPSDRVERERRLHEPPPPGGRIIVSTQVVEAGVDLSSRSLVTELAPWSSIVQRLGRCNRAGEHVQADVRWVAAGSDAPYERPEIEHALALLESLDGKDVSPASLADVAVEQLPLPARHVLRRRDLLDLFDTTPDMSGNDLDIARYIRDSDDLDCFVFWRNWPDMDPPGDMPEALRNELCSAPVGDIRTWLNDRKAWCWDIVESRWTSIQVESVRPGLTLALKSKDGGYDPVYGWDPGSRAPVAVVDPADATEPEGNQDDPESEARTWQSLDDHTRLVEKSVAQIFGAARLPGTVVAAGSLAARTHDVGKAHPRFQAALRRCGPAPEAPEAVWAKSPCRGHLGHDHPRHEVVSLLQLLQSDVLPEGDSRDLVLYLVISHHGKARLSVRASRIEKESMMGICEGDVVPAVRIGGLEIPEIRLSLEAFRLGGTDAGPSWTGRALRLRDSTSLGPFRLAHLEALFRAADWRASAIVGANA